MSNYLVTGGAGFIGSNIVEYLVEQGDAVRVVDNFSTGRRENIEPLLDKIELVEGDLRDAATCAGAVEDMDFVIHQAALPSVPRSVEDPLESTEMNVLATVQLLNACVKAKVGRVVYAASSSAYGDQEHPSKNETLPLNPLSPYAAAKLAGEHFCHAFHASYGLETICLRYFNIFGPRQDPNSPYSAVICRFIAAMSEGRQPEVHGDGLQSRDFTYVTNVIRANVLATTAGAEAVGKSFNVGCGKSYSLLSLVAELNSILGTTLEPTFTEPRPGDVRDSLADIGLAQRLLGYQVEVEFDEGLRRTVEWYGSPTD